MNSVLYCIVLYYFHVTEIQVQSQFHLFAKNEPTTNSIIQRSELRQAILIYCNYCVDLFAFKDILFW